MLLKCILCKILYDSVLNDCVMGHQHTKILTYNYNYNSDLQLYILSLCNHYVILIIFKSYIYIYEWTESGDVELLGLVRNVWTVAPSLTVPRFALQAIKVENMYRRFVLESGDVEAAGGTDEVLQNILLAHVKLDLLGPLVGGLDEGLYGVL